MTEETGRDEQQQYCALASWPLILLVLFLIGTALVSGYVMGLVAGYRIGTRAGMEEGMRIYEEAYCREYPFTLIDPAQFQACRKVGRDE